MHKFSSDSKTHCRGFTLVELLVVIVIILILVAGAVKIGVSVKEKAEIKNTQATIIVLMAALKEYYDYSKTYPVGDMAAAYRAMDALPVSSEVLSRLSDGSMKGSGDNLRIIDAWDASLTYIYLADGNFPTISSNGPDGVEGTADDILSSEL